jgi:hypothetical protein
MSCDPGLTIISPETWSEEFLKNAFAGPMAHGSKGRFVAFFDPKADEDCRVHPGQNVFLNYPSVNKERLQAFTTAVDSIMREGQDFMIVFEGKVKENRGVVLKCLEEHKLHHREMTMIADKEQLDLVLKEGAAKKKRRVHRGFATAKYRENCFICWKGKVPRVAKKRRRFVDVGSRVADDVMSNVPVLAVDERPRVAADKKDEIMKGSTWAGKPCDPEPGSSGGDESSVSSDTHKEKKHKDDKDKKTKRGRALLRQPTDNAAVPLFSHPMHPTLIKEFVTSLEATWAIFGTPESGCGLLGCLSPDTRVPVLSFARNKAHADVLKTFVKTSIANQCLLLGSEWASKSLAEQWAQLNSDSDSSDSCSGNHDKSDNESFEGGRDTEAEGERKKGKRGKADFKAKGKDTSQTHKTHKKKEKTKDNKEKTKHNMEGDEQQVEKRVEKRRGGIIQLEEKGKKDGKKVGKKHKPEKAGSSGSVIDALLKMSGAS